MLFLVDCETNYGAVSPIQEAATEIGIVLFDAPPFPHSLHLVRTTPAFSRDTMQGARDWLLEHSSDSRPLFVSDNPAFDWQWVSAAFAHAGIPNPFGHSGRRISDFAAGLKRDFRQTQYWKRFRRTPHDHNPVNDSRGNAEALWALFESLRQGP